MPILGTPQGRQPLPDEPYTGLLRTPDEFSEFYRSQFRSVVGLVFSLTSNRALAEELAQDAFVDAHRRWSHVRLHPRPDLWVRRAAVNRSNSMFRRRQAEHRALLRTDKPKTSTDDHESAVIADAAWLLALIAKLPRQQSASIVLVHVEQLSNGEAASVLGCSESTLRTHLQRGRESLRASITQDKRHER